MPGARPSTRMALRVLAFATALAPFSVRAQTAVPPARSAAQEDAYEPLAEGLFRDGLRAFDAGEFDAACAALGESLHLDPKLGTLLNVALCHEKQGRVAAAWLEYAHAAAWAAQVGQTNRHDFAVEHGAALERRLFRVRLVLPAEPSLAVEVDGESLPTPLRSLPLFLDPGDHTITVSAPGRRPYQSSLHVLPGPNVEELRVPALAAALVAPPPPPVPVPAKPSGDRRRSVVFVLGAAGLIAVGVGAVFGAEAIVKVGDIGTCTGSSCGADPRGQARTAEVGSLVGLGVGAVALGAAVVVSLGSPKRARLGPTTLLVRPVGSGAEVGIVQAW